MSKVVSPGANDGQYETVYKINVNADTWKTGKVSPTITMEFPKLSNTCGDTSTRRPSNTSITGNTVLMTKKLHSQSEIIRQKMNWLFELHNSTLHQEFYEFNREQGLTYFFSFVVLFVLLILVPAMILNIYLVGAEDYHVSGKLTDSLIMSIFSLVVALILAFLGSSIYIAHYFQGFPELLSFITGRLCCMFSRLFPRPINSSSQVPHDPQNKSAGVTSSSNPIEFFRSLRIFNRLLPASNNRVLPLKPFDLESGDPETVSPSREPSDISAKTSSSHRLPFYMMRLLRNNFSARCLRTFTSIDKMKLYKHAFVILAQAMYFLSFIRNAILRDCHEQSSEASAVDSRTFRDPNVLLPTPFSSCEYPDFYIFFHGWLLLFLPFFLFISLPDISIVCVWITILASLIVVAGIAAFMDAHRCWTILLAYLISVICLVIDTQIRKIQMFLLTKDLKETLSENERMADENHAQEMRHMIANVAHDLKTPLASFITGVDYIQLAIDDCKSLHSAQETLTSSNNDDDTANLDTLENHTQTKLSNNFESIQSCIENIKNTHAFMLMTINRCIDYTKASKGLKLVPKHETVDIKDAIELSISCMRNMQNKIGIIVNHIPDEVCQYAITDKQWLQENVLCLLSNAVKYSVEGNVTITISVDESCQSDAALGVKSCSVRRSGCGLLSGHSVCSSKDRSELNSQGVISNISGNISARSIIACKNNTTDYNTFLRIEVEDTGIGMTEEAMASLFNPFKQTQRLAGGTGLGLYSLAKRLEALHGFYGVMKRRDGLSGSIFWFAIPYKADTLYAYHMQGKLRKSKAREVQMTMGADMGSILKEPDLSISVQSGQYLSEDPPKEISVVIPRLRLGSGPDAVSSSNPSPRSPHRKVSIDRSVPLQGTSAVVSTLTISTVFTIPELYMPRSNGLDPTIMVENSEGKTGMLPTKLLPTVVDSNRNEVITQPSVVLNILLVDDSPTIVKMSTMMLKRMGHKVTSAENGAIAVKFVEERMMDPTSGLFDAIFMDLQMPVMDGLEATRRIRALEINFVGNKMAHDGEGSERSIPLDMEGTSDSNDAENSIQFSQNRLRPKGKQWIIGMSANSDHETTEHALAAGADSFLPKPFSIEHVKSILYNLFSSSSDSFHS